MKISGPLSQRLDLLMSSSEVLTVRDFAESVAAAICNTTAYYHTGPIADAAPLLVKGSDVVGISHSGHLRFCWEAADVTQFCEEGVFRAQKLAGKDEWVYFDMSTKAKNCNTCTTQARRPVSHAKGEPCPGFAAPSQGIAKHGLVVSEVTAVQPKASVKVKRRGRPKLRPEEVDYDEDVTTAVSAAAAFFTAKPDFQNLAAFGYLDAADVPDVAVSHSRKRRGPPDSPPQEPPRSKRRRLLLILTRRNPRRSVVVLRNKLRRLLLPVYVN